MFKKNKDNSSKLFKRIGFGFIGLTVFLLFVVMYMALSRATIIVEPKEEEIKADLLVTVKEENLRSGDVLGKLGKVEVSREAVFTSSGKGVKVPGTAGGTITIINEYTKNQPLIKTTRFLSEGGVLFRLKEDVTALAGGSVQVEVYADEEGTGGDIGPTTFTIPGLSKSLQSKIYGKSEASMTGGTITVNAIAQKDIDDAAENMRASLLSEAGGKLQTLLNQDQKFTNVVYKDIIKTKEANVKAGDTAENFKLKLELEVVGVAYSAALQNQAAKTLSNMIVSDRKLVSSNILELKPTIEKYDMESKSANLKVELVGKTIINANSPVFDKEKLAGMTEEEVKKYLEQYGVQNVEIKFFPFWMDKVPKLRDHIKVVVK
ncbi:hypothetical protein KJ885_00330 [Patescibacteria group bacterium]|nr:hypothetical protein [Patescibacteria group bacterium]